MDYFLGGGTTAEVCKRLDRRFIGFEIDSTTFEIAQARLKNGIGPSEKSKQEVLPFV